MSIFQLLKDKREPFFLKVTEESLLHSLGTPQEKLLDAILEQNDSGDIGVWLYRRNGITQAEREQAGDAYSTQEEKRKEYYALLASCSRNHQIPDQDIVKALQVNVGTEAVQLRRQAAILEFQKIQEQSEAIGEQSSEEQLASLNEKLVLLQGLTEKFKLNDDSEVQRQQEKNRAVVSALGPDFTRLTVISDAFDKATENYRYQLAAQILSSHFRVQKLESMPEKERRAIKFTPEDVRALSTEFVQTLFQEFINKEMAGKNGWSDLALPEDFSGQYSDGTIKVADHNLEDGKTYRFKVIEVVDVEPEKPEGKAQKKS